MHDKNSIDFAPASYVLRNKKGLIETSIDSLDVSEGVAFDWECYIVEAKKRELSAIVKEESLDKAVTEAFINKVFVDGEIETTGTNITNLMNYKPSRSAPDVSISNWRIGLSPD